MDNFDFLKYIRKNKLLLEKVLPLEVGDKIVADLNPTEPIKVKVVDKKSGKESIVLIGPNGEEQLEENTLKNLAVAAICTIMASGMVSCTKEKMGGNGYNIGNTYTSYDRTDGNPDTTVHILTPTGLKTFQVDKSKISKGMSSSGTIILQKPTEDEWTVVKFGSALKAEENMNNDKGTSTDRYVVDVDPSKGYVDEKPGYVEHGIKGGPLKTIRDHEYFKDGLKFMKQYPDQFEAAFGETPAAVISRL